MPYRDHRRSPEQWELRATCVCRSPDDARILQKSIFGSPTAQKGFIRDYCRRCPVTMECREAGRTEGAGVWGGVAHSESTWLRERREDRGPRVRTRSVRVGEWERYKARKQAEGFRQSHRGWIREP